MQGTALGVVGSRDNDFVEDNSSSDDNTFVEKDSNSRKVPLTQYYFHLHIEPFYFVLFSLLYRNNSHEIFLIIIAGKEASQINI